MNSLMISVQIILGSRDLKDPQFEDAFAGLEEDVVDAGWQHVDAGEGWLTGVQTDHQCEEFQASGESSGRKRLQEVDSFE